MVIAFVLVRDAGVATAICDGEHRGDGRCIERGCATDGGGGSACAGGRGGDVGRAVDVGRGRRRGLVIGGCGGARGGWQLRLRSVCPTITIIIINKYDY